MVLTVSHQAWHSTGIQVSKLAQKKTQEKDSFSVNKTYTVKNFTIPDLE